MEIYRLYDLRQAQHAQPRAGLFALACLLNFQAGYPVSGLSVMALVEQLGAAFGHSPEVAGGQCHQTNYAVCSDTESGNANLVCSLDQARHYTQHGQC